MTERFLQNNNLITSTCSNNFNAYGNNLLRGIIVSANSNLQNFFSAINARYTI